MSPIIAVAAAASLAYTDYPGALSRSSPVEAAIDRGTVVEMIVRCGDGAGIMRFSKVERLFCDPKLRCHAKFAAAHRATCAGR